MFSSQRYLRTVMFSSSFVAGWDQFLCCFFCSNFAGLTAVKWMLIISLFIYTQPKAKNHNGLCSNNSFLSLKMFFETYTLANWCASAILKSIMCRPEKKFNLSAFELCNAICLFEQGVLEAIRISCLGYPTRRTFYEFVNRFGILHPKALSKG